VAVKSSALVARSAARGARDRERAASRAPRRGPGTCAVPPAAAAAAMAWRSGAGEVRGALRGGDARASGARRDSGWEQETLATRATREATRIRRAARAVGVPDNPWTDLPRQPIGAMADVHGAAVASRASNAPSKLLHARRIVRCFDETE
jgi:hypothetical protein